MLEIHMDLSPESISDAIKQLKKYNRTVPKNTNKVVKKVADYGKQTAKQSAPRDTGELSKSVSVEVTEAGRRVVAENDHAAFNEFGTGIVGSAHPHPQMPEGVEWVYDVNQHGEKGWRYKGEDGKWHWTKGLPSRPFMFNTAALMKDQIIPIAEEVFSK